MNGEKPELIGSDEIFNFIVRNIYALICIYFKLLGYFIAFVAVGAVVAFLVFKIVDFRKTGIVPLLAGKRITESAELLVKRKLILNIEGKEHHDEIPEGNIIKQNVDLVILV